MSLSADPLMEVHIKLIVNVGGFAYIAKLEKMTGATGGPEPSCCELLPGQSNQGIQYQPIKY